MKALIDTDDDVGLNRGMTEGAIRAHREGIVTACSIVANGRAFDDAVQRLREVPELETGVHLTLVEEQSLTGIALPGRYPEFFKAFMRGEIRIPQIEAELRAQVKKVADTGLRLTHLNGHQHLHVMSGIFEIVLTLAEEYGIRYVRIVDDRDGKAPLARRFAITGLNFLGRRARTRAAYRVPDPVGELKPPPKYRTNDRTIGVLEAGHITDVGHLLDRVDGLTELVTHPGVNVDGYAHWKYEWDAETRALCAPGLKEAIAARGIALIAPSAVRAH